MERLPATPIYLLAERHRRRPAEQSSVAPRSGHDAPVISIETRQEIPIADAKAEYEYMHGYTKVVSDIIDRGIDAIVERLGAEANDHMAQNIQDLYQEMRAEHITPFDILEYLQPEIELMDELLGHQLQDALEEMRQRNRSPRV